MTMEELQKYAPEATADTWHQHGNGGGWVHNTASVPDIILVPTNACVGEGAWIGAGARIGAGAEIGAWTKIGAGARIGAGAGIGARTEIGEGTVWSVSPLYVIGTRHLVHMYGPGLLKIGCEVHEIAWWQEHYRALGRQEKYTPEQVAEYKCYIDLAETWDKLYFPKGEPDAANHRASAGSVGGSDRADAEPYRVDVGGTGRAGRTA